MTESIAITALHGTQAFSENAQCNCTACESKRAAVRRLVDSFSRVPYDWIADLAEKDGEPIALPMWGTLFVVDQTMTKSAVMNLLRVPDPDGDNSEDIDLAESGWSKVGDTGIHAREFRDELLLGINGGGYDFYSEHWEPLYNELGYQWHESVPS